MLEPLAGYLKLAEKLVEDGEEYAEAWNFGPRDEDAKPVEWIVREMTDQWGDDASWSIDAGDHPHEASHLKLDCSKASSKLLWRPKWNLHEALKKIIEWHKEEAQGKDVRQLTICQIDEYTNTRMS